MFNRYLASALAVSLLSAAPCAAQQFVSGVMIITGAEMH